MQGRKDQTERKGGLASSVGVTWGSHISDQKQQQSDTQRLEQRSFSGWEGVEGERGGVGGILHRPQLNDSRAGVGPPL